MKNIIAIIIIIFSSTFLIASTDGWREGEMEIKITLNNQTKAKILYDLHLHGDVYPDGSALLYVIPSELEKLKAAGFDYTIEKKDLNTYYENFWDNREAYHTYQEIIDLADSLSENFPEICQKMIFGYSVEERQLMGLKISDNVAVDETEAEILLDGGIHGDEIGAAENLIRFARDLCLDYGNDPDITYLIDNREIWLYFMVNPDGRVAMARYNANGVDLNRDWGYMWDAWGGSPDASSQVETRVCRDVMLNNQFSVQITYHSGIEMAIYPWGYRSDPANDIAHLDFITGLYSSVSGYANLPYGQATMLYPVNGSTMDALLGVMGSAGMTVEISSNKQPPTNQLMQYYNYNLPSMIAMIEQAGYGVEGTITDAETDEPVAATVFVNDYFPAYSDPVVGDYHKYITPGTYTITVVANGYETQTIENVIVNENSSTVVDVTLLPEDGQYVYKVIATRIPGNNFNNEAFTPAAIGAPDLINYSIGRNGWIITDLQSTIWDGPGNEITVYEGDDTPEGFSCFASPSIDGPWGLLGDGEGTTEFDLQSGSIAEARYIKIVDDGDGSGSTNDAGFDLDAIQGIESIAGIYLIVMEYEVNDENGNGNGRIDPGETVDIYVNIRNNGQDAAENISGIISTDMPFVIIENSAFNFGTLNHGETSDGTFSITASELTPAGSLLILDLLLETGNGSYSEDYTLNFVIGIIVEDWESGYFSSYDWVPGGNSPWVITESNPYEGIYCAKSGNISDNQSSELSVELDIIADGNILFHRKVSSEAAYDFLEFYIDNNLVDKWAGELDWEEVSFPVFAGTHTFKWIYTKDVYVTNGQDCGWIDFIVFPPLGVENLGTLAGTVTDITTGLPIEGAWIGGVVQTETNGQYSINLSPGNYEVCAYHDDYEMLCLDASIIENETTTLNFELLSSVGLGKFEANSVNLSNNPNPFSDQTNVLFTLDGNEKVVCEIFSTEGKKIKTLIDKYLEAGSYSFQWDGSDRNGYLVHSGIYFCKLQTENHAYLIKILKL